MAIPSAARAALTIRFADVREALSRALRQPAGDPELVHKLRVAVRRATAALDAFAERLPPAVYRKARRGLRRYRRAAGAARDWDVFFDLVSARPSETPGVDAVLGWAAAKRGMAQAAISGFGEDHPADINRLLSDTVSAVARLKADHPRTVTDLARMKVSNALAALSAAAHMPMSDDQMHAVRIAGKRVRYAVEVFAGCLSAEFRRRLTDEMKALQDALGSFNDAVVAGRHLGELSAHFRDFHPAAWDRIRPGVEDLTAHFNTQRQAERVRFEVWRTGWNGAEFASLLSNNPDSQ